MKTPLLFLLMLAPLAVAQEQIPATPSRKLDAIIFTPAPWEKKPTDMGADLEACRFEWVSAAKDAARSAAKGMTLGTQPVNEIVLRFKDEKLTSATLLYYSRGNEGDLREKQFDDRLAAITQDLTTLTGAQPEERGRDAGSAVRAESRVWETTDSQYLLEWSVTRESKTKGIPFRAEFIRLTVQPKGQAQTAIGATTSGNTNRAAIKQFVGKDHVEKTPTGDVKLKDVPMVDQGQKGYCVVASMERVMRYYGATVDQDELAQIANSDASGGTNTMAMMDSLKRMTSRLGVKSKSLYEWNITEFLDIMSDYNRATKRGKVAPEVPIGGSVIDVDACMNKVDPTLYKEVRLKKAADFGKFQREVIRSIDEGLPLLWSVRLGLISEPGLPQIGGGHMRLIIGYNNTTKELIYSDSWGMGHEEKRMPIADAWTMTTGLNSLTPIGS